MYLFLTFVLASSPLIEKGERVYHMNCIACHASDPSDEGSVGPAIAGSSRELVEARVLRASYPKGYKPKRNSFIMPAFPFLDKDIDAITAYLNKDTK